MSTVPAYPLQWPHGWRRTPAFERSSGNFKSQKRKITVHEAINRLRTELGRIGVTENDMVISTNARLRLDGLPRSGDAEPFDAGAAVYWIDIHGDRRCLAIDRYDYLAQNIAALASTLEHMRAIERHGSAQILERAMSGFNALPAPGQSRSWRDILGIEPGHIYRSEDIDRLYRERASKAHPDKGGSHDAMADLNRAREEAMQALGQS